MFLSLAVTALVCDSVELEKQIKCRDFAVAVSLAVTVLIWDSLLLITLLFSSSLLDARLILSGTGTTLHSEILRLGGDLSEVSHFWHQV